MTKNTKITIIGVIALLVLLTGYVAYSLLTASTSITNMNIAADIKGPVKFTVTGTGNISNQISEELMLGNSITSFGGVSNMTVTLETDGLEGVCCDYDFIWTWKETDVKRNQYQISPGAENWGEFFVKGYLTRVGSADDTGTLWSLDKNEQLFAEHAPNYDASSLSTSIYRATICNNKHFSASGFTTKRNEQYSLYYTFNNLEDVAQDQHRGAKYENTVQIDNVACRKSVGGVADSLLSEAVLAKESANEYTSSQDGSKYKVTNPTVSVPNPTNYTKLTKAEYGDVIEYQGTSASALPSAGTETNGMFDYNANDRTWTNDITNMAASSYYSMVVPVQESASYQICNKINSAASSNRLYVYITNGGSTYSGYLKTALLTSSATTSYECTDLGYLVGGQGVRIVHTTGSTKASVSFYLQKSSEVTTNGNVGVRYQGKDPDNYVTFNNETAEWRIIGTFEGSTIGLGAGKYYTKIIKNASIGSYYWDETDAENNWVNASLNNYLTNTYLAGITSSSKSLIANNVTWHLGGAPSTASSTYTAGQFYMAERGSTGGAAAPSVITHQNSIGLMYPSDYAYAMYAGSSQPTCTPNMGVYIYSTIYETCANYDWLFLKLTEWLITPHSVNSYYAHYVSPKGEVSSDYVFNYKFAVRPVLYLEADTKIASGTGKQSDPYVLTRD